MTDALLKAVAMQKEDMLFGQKDIKSSFCVLVERGLIESAHKIVGGQTQFIWEVTEQAIQMLRDLGIEVPA